MRAHILLVLLMIFPATSIGEEALMPYAFTPDLSDKKALQRGGRTFVNYCLSCHSATYMRYNRMGEDLEIPDDVLLESFMFGTDKTGDTMNIAMTKDSANQYFGIPAPDLSVIARSRGAEWLYNYLMTFYLDPSRPTGVNNLIFKDVAMPHVLWELQGWQKAVYEEATGVGGVSAKGINHLELAIQPDEKPEEYRGESYEESVGDLVNFMVYMGEPIRLKRYYFGAWVIGYLFLFLIIAYLLKKEYWKDIQ